MSDLKVYTCTNFEGHYPVGVAAIIVANGEEQARLLLMAAMKMEGLEQENPLNLAFEEIDTNKFGATILMNGDY